MQIGIAVFSAESCLRQAEGLPCDKCVRHCPVKDVDLQESECGQLPVIDATKCIGCGSCEYHCPAIPKAIIVSGNQRQRVMTTPNHAYVNLTFRRTFYGLFYYCITRKASGLRNFSRRPRMPCTCCRQAIQHLPL